MTQLILFLVAVFCSAFFMWVAVKWPSVGINIFHLFSYFFAALALVVIVFTTFFR